MEKNNNSSWAKDFMEFVAVDVATVPSQLNDKVLSEIHKELHPSAVRVFAKLSIFHFFVGLMTLLLCPQFGVSLTSSLGLMSYLMRFGESVCMLGCGTLFTGLSLLIASFALKTEEIRTLQQHRILNLLSLSILSLVVFLFVGGELALVFSLVWLIGAMGGGLLALEAGWVLRVAYLRGLKS